MVFRACVVMLALGLVVAASATVFALEAQLERRTERAAASERARARAAAIGATLRERWGALAATRLQYLQFRDGRIVSGVAALGEANRPEDLNLMFVDYLCGFCRADHERFLALVRSRPEERFYVAHAPVLGERSVALARIALAGDEPGAFARMHGALLEAAPPASAAPEGDGVDALLQQQAALASALRISATPVYLLRGTLVFGTLRQYSPRGQAAPSSDTNQRRSIP